MTGHRGIRLLSLLAVTLLLVLVLAPSSASMVASLTSSQARLGCAVAVAVLHLTSMTGWRWPAASFTAVCAAALVLTLAPLGRYEGRPAPMVLAPSMICFLVALYWVAATCRPRPAGLALAVSVIGGVMVLVRLQTGSSWRSQLAQGPLAPVVFAAVVFALPTAAWVSGRLRRRVLADRARSLQQAAADERARIVADLHDVVSHSLAVMITQAEGGRMIAPDERTRTLLNTISTTGRGALADMRAMLGVLRSGPEGTTRPPAPGTADLEELARRSGAHFKVAGRPCPVPAGVAVAAHRVTQEALTNALKHGSGTPTVRLTWGEQLSVVVENPVARAGRQSCGLGLDSMRGRTETVGGSFRAGPVEGGWRVRCDLPVVTQ